MRKLFCAALAALLLAPTFGAAIEQPGAPTPAPAASQKKCDVNRATIQELIDVPGIGPSTAQAILDLRKKKGSFTKLEELLEVQGIGAKKLEALVAHLVVTPPASAAQPQSGAAAQR